MAFIKDQRTRAYQKFLSVVTSAVSDSAMLSVAGQKLTANVEQPTGEAKWVYYSYQGGCIPGDKTLLPPFFGTTNTSAFSKSAQSRFASVVLDGVLGSLRRA